MRGNAKDPLLARRPNREGNPGEPHVTRPAQPLPHAGDRAAEIIHAAEKAGADAISLINTFFALAVDAETQKPKPGNITGGLSGPAIKPISLRMVWDVSKKVKIPIIGMMFTR